MPNHGEIAAEAARLDSYLATHLLPFWLEKSPDPPHGGFLSYFDRDGHPTGETSKTFLMQIRLLYTWSSAHRAGYGDGACAVLARQAADFILRNYWDETHDGWVWIADRRGHPTCQDKVGYGQCFGIYAFSEYFLATGDERGREAALRTYDAICRHMVDTRHGGFLELMSRDWTPLPGKSAGGDRKSMDVHMHMMEAFTSLYEITGSPTHRRRLQEVIDLLLSHVLHPENRLSYIQFTHDWRPLGRILFETQWGRDAGPDAGTAQPLDMTSPGHNVEFVWLLLHATDVLGQPRTGHADVVRAICDHCIEFGIDHEFGGVYADAPMARPTTNHEKQFWQQGEVMIGMLDAYAMFGDETYWRAYRNVSDFLFENFVAWAAGGELYERLDRRGAPIDDALAHAWKINYHSVRSPLQSISRLKSLLPGDGEA